MIFSLRLCCLCLFCFVGLAQTLWAQPLFERAIGGPKTDPNSTLNEGTDDSGQWVGQMSDGGYYTIGATDSYSGQKWKFDFLIVCTDSNGVLRWKKALGTDLANLYSWGYKAVIDPNDDLTLVGESDGQIALLRFNRSGDLLFQRSLGAGTGAAICRADNGYLVAAYRDATIFAIPIGFNGLPYGQARTFTLDGYRFAVTDIERAPDGSGYYLTGYNTIGEWWQPQAGDQFLIKLNNVLGLIWAKRYGGPGQDEANAVVPLPEGDAVIIGTTTSFNPWNEADNNNVYATRVDPNGEIVWSNTYGGLWQAGNTSIQYYKEGANDAVLAADYTIVTAGWKDYYENNIDLFSVKIDQETGGVFKDRRLGGNSPERGYGLAQTRDNGFIFTGETKPYNIDLYLAKTDSLVSTNPCVTNPAIETFVEQGVLTEASVWPFVADFETINPQELNLINRTIESIDKQQNGLLAVQTSIEVKQITCPGETDGSVSIRAQGGIPEYRFFLGNADTINAFNTFPRGVDSVFTNLAPGRYVVLAADNSMCTGQHFFTIDSVPPLKITANRIDPYCPGEIPGTIVAKGSGGRAPLRMVVSILGLAVNDSVLNHAITAPGDYIITLFDRNDCFITDTINVKEGPLVEAGATDTFKLPAVNGQLTIFELSAATPEGGFWRGAGVIDSVKGRVDIAQLPAGTYELTYTADGCSDRKNFVVVEPDLLNLIGNNVLTPNADGFNDELALNLPAHADFRLRVYAAEGQLVYETRNPDERWKARLANGNIVPVGVYYYVLSFKPLLKAEAVFTGHVTVLY